MTLLIGIVCSDGIVMGADGAATLGLPGQQTVRQSVRKLDIIGDNNLIYGCSGPVGLGQRFKGEIEEAWKAHTLWNKEPHKVMKILREALWSQAKTEWDVSDKTKNVIGGNALLTCSSHSLLALPIRKIPSLIQFDPSCHPELASDNLPFVSAGSGMGIADPFLAFIRRVFWSEKKPSLPEGIFAALWTLEHAVETNAGGVARPIQIMTLDKENKAREVSKQELQEHHENIRSAEMSLKCYKDAFSKKSPDEEEIKMPELDKKV